MTKSKKAAPGKMMKKKAMMKMAKSGKAKKALEAMGMKYQKNA